MVCAGDLYADDGGQLFVVLLPFVDPAQPWGGLHFLILALVGHGALYPLLRDKELKRERPDIFHQDLFFHRGELIIRPAGGGGPHAQSEVARTIEIEAPQDMVGEAFVVVDAVVKGEDQALAVVFEYAVVIGFSEEIEVVLDGSFVGRSGQDVA